MGTSENFRELLKSSGNFGELQRTSEIIFRGLQRTCGKFCDSVADDRTREHFKIEPSNTTSLA
jgi:hypothetical protein